MEGEAEAEGAVWRAVAQETAEAVCASARDDGAAPGRFRSVPGQASRGQPLGACLPSRELGPALNRDHYYLLQGDVFELVKLPVVHC